MTLTSGHPAGGLVEHRVDVWVSAPKGAEDGRGIANALLIKFIGAVGVVSKFGSFTNFGAVVTRVTGVG
jgi:hypothetical protein